ncbi:MAG: transcriptional regulator [Flavobacteriaceae bacterium CG_4_8_14_3_um_filter_34_10]|nr:winged helix-turn-helix transcriptional regulator [Flavobacteriia bacterium]OIP50203.1 MAG: transcriptional regulator [Flavobacteriaceae bacterium CG2_30_34_30]PIQ19040.1 MAG: transcriptional regulator [Flavobacteriaceae bacterium CG18_big_fil_WC_8_21_14_2_50_34_36]PIV49371.1 MAG: transcriptional regulator [Flavobacteriaceae bacterium CG02_land_8_20_14_3_00_34_13]PIX09813.1 MAG: transcriptional regulator [Flavobacteriaceae bacterium CG_4_8_14_3_um_filter_34_10]PIZ08813.1 MAG: transcriptiona
MGVTKTDLFSQTQNELASLAKVFAHPARVAIIQHLLKSNTCCNSHLIEEIGLAQATISQHLKELKNSGILQGTIEGVSVSYCINPERWSEIKDIFTKFFESYESPNCNTNC